MAPPLPRKHPVLWWAAWAAIAFIVLWAGLSFYAGRDRLLVVTRHPTKSIQVRVVARPWYFALTPLGLPTPVDIIAVVTEDGSRETWELQIHHEDLLDDARRDFRHANWHGNKVWFSPGVSTGVEFVDVVLRKAVDGDDP